MSVVGYKLCWALLEEKDLDVVRQSGIKPEMVRGEAQECYEYILQHYLDYGVMPKEDTVLDDVDVHPDMVDLDVDEPCLYYATKVVRNAAIRAQRKHVKEIGEALGDRDPERVYECAKEVLRESVWQFHLGQGRITNLKNTGDTEWAEYEKRKAAKDGVVGIRSIWDALDQETGGWQPGMLTTIVARLGVGKTWLLLLIACAIEEQGYTVGFVSLEMEESAIRIRRRAIKECIPYRDYKRGELDSETEERIKELLLSEPDEEAPSFFVASGGRVTDIAEAEIFAEETGCDVLVVDGIYLMDEGGKNTPMHERTLLAIRGLKRLGQRKRIPTFASAQFNRKVKKGSMQAGSEAIGGSDAIGQDSDNVFGAFRDKDHIIAHQMFLSSLKIREGVPIEMTIGWDFQTMNFTMVDVGVMGDDDDDEHDKSETLF
jgi:hypothetical protein